MRVIWQMVETIINSILIYASGSWKLTEEEKGKLHTNFKDEVKTILYPPKDTPATIILSETGNLPVEHIISEKQLLQANSIDEMKDEALIKDATEQDQSSLRNMFDEIAYKYHVKEIMGITKNTPKTLIQKGNRGKNIQAKINEDIENEAKAKTKGKHRREGRQNANAGVRPMYMDQLTRKQCNTITKTRVSMIMVKGNYKKGNDNNFDCRFCRMEPETQVYILQECPDIGNTIGKCNYESIFKMT